MSDFWQAPSGGLIINLDQVAIVERLALGDLRITTLCAGITLKIEAGSPDQAPFLRAIGERIGSAGQLIAMLGDIREAIDRIEPQVKEQ